jgi:hypothetical protein
MSEDFWAVVGRAIDALSPVLLAAFSWLSFQIAAYLKARVKNEKHRAGLRRLDEAVFVAVREVEQRLVASLRTASVDGTLTQAEGGEVKTAATNAVRAYLGAKSWLELGLALGLSELELDRVLAARVEAAVYDLRAHPARVVSTMLRAAFRANNGVGTGPHNSNGSGSNGSA